MYLQCSQTWPATERGVQPQVSALIVALLRVAAYTASVYQVVHLGTKFFNEMSEKNRIEEGPLKFQISCLITLQVQ